jgi:hypothetical protein
VQDEASRRPCRLEKEIDQLKHAIIVSLMGLSMIYKVEASMHVPYYAQGRNKSNENRDVLTIAID